MGWNGAWGYTVARELREQRARVRGAEVQEEQRARDIETSAYARDLARRFIGETPEERERGRGW